MKRTNSGISRSEDEYLDKGEIAEKLGIKPRTVNEWMRVGRLPFYKFGRVVRFRWDETKKHLSETCKIG